MTFYGSWQYGRPRNSMRSLMRQFQIEPIISNWIGKLKSLDIFSTMDNLVWPWIFMKYVAMKIILRNCSPMTDRLLRLIDILRSMGWREIGIHVIILSVQRMLSLDIWAFSIAIGTYSKASDAYRFIKIYIKHDHIRIIYNANVTNLVRNDLLINYSTKY